MAEVITTLLLNPKDKLTHKAPSKIVADFFLIFYAPPHDSDIYTPPQDSRRVLWYQVGCLCVRPSVYPYVCMYFFPLIELISLDFHQTWCLH